MIQHVTSEPASGVPPEEAERRIAEYRREGFRHQAMPHGVYQYPMTAKQAVNDPVAAGLTVLPDNWHHKAYIG